MKKLKLSTLYYIIGFFVVFILFNNIDFNKSEISSPKEEKEIVGYLIENEDKNIVKSDIFKNVSNFIILSAFIGLVVVLFFAKKEQYKKDDENIENIENDVNYLGRFCVDFKITIEELQEIAKKKSN
ncbi:hypothetical protein N3114_12655 (plasmid) [Aliarcobacter butzleri]|uniref:hypothetical protein n=1 Tax=Aliarcobacter butzleri TaxID=28197 RepID=UPI0021B33DE7|nr:hypothetical protein [Aliarcobacter butzleri]UXC30740.1 hypothetical protein N3114_12655 [Aliarcobacter butzleri]